MTTEKEFISAETDSLEALNAWSSHEYFITHDEEEGSNTGRMRLKFRLIFNVPESELWSFMGTLSDFSYVGKYDKL